MAPKAHPPVPRKSAVAKASQAPDTVKQEQDAKAMPPPAPPAPKILVPQVEALRTTLKNVAVKTGEIYAFYADTRKLYAYFTKIRAVKFK